MHALLCERNGSSSSDYGVTLSVVETFLSGTDMLISFAEAVCCGKLSCDLESYLRGGRDRSMFYWVAIEGPLLHTVAL